MNKRNIILVTAAAAILFVLYGQRAGWFKRSAHEAPSHVTFSLDQIKNKKNLVDIAVIGSGPAGWSAGLYGARLGNYTVVIDGNMPGGQLTRTSFIENWPGLSRVRGQAAMDHLAGQAKSFGAEELKDTVTSVDLHAWPYTIKTEDGHTLYAASIVVATGSSPRNVNIPGEMEFYGRGVSTCAICDAPFFKNKNAIVIGGGDSAAEEALQLAVYAKKVTVLVRKEAMRASYTMQQRLKAAHNVEILTEVEPERITGVDTVKAVEVRFKKTNELKVIQTDGFFIAIGHHPNTALFQGSQLLNEKGYIKVHAHTQETTMPGIFAAGDVEDDLYRQAGVAAGHGIAAGIDADRFLRDVGLSGKFRDTLKKGKAYFSDFYVERAEIATLPSLAAFNEQIANKKGIFVLDFAGKNCPSCKAMLPVVESAASRYAGKMTFFKVDIDEAKDLVMSLKVPKVPYIIVFKDGVRVAFFNGAMSRTEFFGHLNAILSQE